MTTEWIPDGDATLQAARRGDASRWIAGLHDELTALFGHLDGGGVFREDRWERPGGGGGVARVMLDGHLFEKAGINRSVVDGVLPAEAARRLGGRGAAAGSTHFFATGVSMVVHPRSPMVPTVHLNVRYLELSDQNGVLTDSWFAGGTDLTPYYPYAEDARDFHRALQTICATHHPSFYPDFKKWCDEYFVNAHRGNEARGLGGVFFDHLRPDDAPYALSVDQLRTFVTAIARSPHTAYAPLVSRRRDEAYGDREQRFQRFRRGRYVEFNLVHDRGTLFGLHTQARTESVLMSLPPLAGWEYAPEWVPGSFESEFMAMLAPRDWVAEPQSSMQGAMTPGR
jgi:coproporphyrinogen III oxidase